MLDNYAETTSEEKTPPDAAKKDRGNVNSTGANDTDSHGAKDGALPGREAVSGGKCECKYE